MKKTVFKFVVFSVIFVGVTSSGDSQEINKDLSKKDTLVSKEKQTFPTVEKKDNFSVEKNNLKKDSILNEVENKISDLSLKQQRLNKLYITLNRKIHKYNQENE